MTRPFPAYKGEDPFIFVSYAHRDSVEVFAELLWLRQQGYNIWYDEGIEPGLEWREEIASAISRCSALVYFVTPASVTSENCRNEVHFAADEKIPILSVHLRTTELTGGLRLTLSTRQAIHKYELSRQGYQEKLLHRLGSYVNATSKGLTAPVERPAKINRKIWFAAIALLLLIGLAGTLLSLSSLLPTEDFGNQYSASETRTEAQSRLRSVAVLPFTNLIDDKANEQFADGLSTDLLTGLSQINNLRVAPGSSSFAFKGQFSDIGEIGRKLKVDTVLEGSVRVVNNKVRVTAQLLLVEDGYQLWSESFDRDFENHLARTDAVPGQANEVFALQDEITRHILSAIRLHLIEAVQGDDDVTPGAYNLYLIARDNMRERTYENLQKAHGQFLQSVTIDPSFAPAWSDLARSTLLLADAQYGKIPTEEAIAEAQGQLDKAFALAPDLATAHATQGFLHVVASNRIEALSSFHQAIASDPNEAYAYFMIADILIDSGDFNESLKMLEKAHKLDEDHSIIKYRLLVLYLAQKNYTAARNLVRTDQSLLVDALIAFREYRTADGIIKAKQYLEVAEEPFAAAHLRLELSRRYYYGLGNVSQAQSSVSKSFTVAGHLYFQSLQYPEVAYQVLRQVPEKYTNRISRYLLVRSEIFTGRFDACVETIAESPLSNQPLQGQVYSSLPGSNIELAFYNAYCLQQIGQVEAAQALNEEVLRYVNRAIANGEPHGYFRALSRSTLLAGKPDEAMTLLRQAWDDKALDWTDLQSPWFDELRDHAEFAQLKKAVQDHMNQERKVLGWDAIEI